jgi:hypothetical protein
MNFKFATTLLLIAALLIAPALAQREAVMTLERSQASSPYIPFCGIVGCLMCCLNGLNGGVSRSMCSLLFDSLLAYCCCGCPGFSGYAIGYLTGVIHSLLRDLIRAAHPPSGA